MLGDWSPTILVDNDATFPAMVEATFGAGVRAEVVNAAAAEHRLTAQLAVPRRGAEFRLSLSSLRHGP
jgi:hypothetical protein